MHKYEILDFYVASDFRKKAFQKKPRPPGAVVRHAPTSLVVLW